MAGDVICEYAFGFSYNHLESPDFEESFHDAFLAVTKFGNYHKAQLQPDKGSENRNSEHRERQQQEA